MKKGLSLITALAITAGICVKSYLLDSNLSKEVFSLAEQESFAKYDVNISNTTWGESGIVCYYTPTSEITSAKITGKINTDKDLQFHVNISNHSGSGKSEKIDIDSENANFDVTVPFTTSELMEINFFVKSNSYPLSYELSDVKMEFSNGAIITNPYIIINRPYCSGTVERSTSSITTNTDNENTGNINTDNTNTENTSTDSNTYTDNINGEYTGKKWIALGDSLTSPNTLGATEKNYVNYVSDKIGITAINKGVGGTGYWKGHTSSEAFYQRAEQITEDADIITIFGSFNDLAYEGGQSGAAIMGDYKDTGTSTICGCINTTIDTLVSKYPTALFGIIAPTPWSNSHDSMACETYVTKLKQIAEYRNIAFLDLYHGSNLRPWDASFREIYYKTPDDGAHPNSEGHKRIAALVVDFIERIYFIE